MGNSTELITQQISWQTKAYGWEGTLEKLNHDRNDWNLPAQTRRAADKSYRRIINNLADPVLMNLRGRLIKASVAGDEPAVAQLTKEMRYYLHEDQETGLYQ